MIDPIRWLGPIVNQLWARNTMQCSTQPTHAFLSCCHLSQRCVSLQNTVGSCIIVPCLLSCQATIFPSMPSFSSFFAAYLYDTSPDWTADCCWLWPENICAMAVKIVVQRRHETDMTMTSRLQMWHVTISCHLSSCVSIVRENICLLTPTSTPIILQYNSSKYVYSFSAHCFSRHNVQWKHIFWCVDRRSLWWCLVTLG